MTGIFAAVTDDGKAFPNGLRIERAWVLFNGKAWEASELTEQDMTDRSYEDAEGVSRNRPGSPTFGVVARNGPKWGPGVEVDVVVGLIDGHGRRTLLRAPKQTVARLE